MKTSFYFVLWILIYPILGLFNNSFINNNAFVVALGFVWGLSWLLNRIMPNTLTYERALNIAPVLEDVYTGNVTSFNKRLSKEATIETVTAIYFIVSTIVIALAIFKAGVNDWIALIIFGFFTFGTVSRSVKLIKAKTELKRNPDREQCMEIAEKTYELDYASYYEARNSADYNHIMPEKPKYFKVFQICSTIISAICTLLGAAYIILGIILFLGQSIEVQTIAGMYFLYGTLATYFGIKDFLSCIRTGNSGKRDSKEDHVEKHY